MKRKNSLKSSCWLMKSKQKKVSSTKIRSKLRYHNDWMSRFNKFSITATIRIMKNTCDVRAALPSSRASLRVFSIMVFPAFFGFFFSVYSVQYHSSGNKLQKQQSARYHCKNNWSVCVCACKKSNSVFREYVLRIFCVILTAIFSCLAAKISEDPLRQA